MGPALPSGHLENLTHTSFQKEVCSSSELPLFRIQLLQGVLATRTVFLCKK